MFRRESFTELGNPLALSGSGIWDHAIQRKRRVLHVQIVRIGCIHQDDVKTLALQQL